jgi:hypothetical protein
MIDQMMAAKLNYWNNKWNDIYDFTPAPRGGQNYTVCADALEENAFVSSLKQIESLVHQIEAKKDTKI